MAVPETREAFLRRLRTLTDEYQGTGRLAQMVTDLYDHIRTEAIRDAKKWDGGDIDLGYQQLMKEQIPTRKEQLLGMYGPGGKAAILPAAQAADTGVKIGQVGSSDAPAEQYVEIVNPTDTAVDLTGFKLTGCANAPIQPGTVIPAKSSLYLVPDIAGFRQRTTGPTEGQGLQVQGCLTGSLSGGAGPLSLTLLDPTGNAADTQAASP